MDRSTKERHIERRLLQSNNRDQRTVENIFGAKTNNYEKRILVLAKPSLNNEGEKDIFTQKLRQFITHQSLLKEQIKDRSQKNMEPKRKE